MLEKAVDERAHLDALAHPGHVGTQPADPRTSSVIGTPACAAVVERLDHVAIDDGVELADDADGRPARACSVHGE